MVLGCSGDSPTSNRRLEDDSQIIAQPPEKITKSKTSRTAPFLKIALRM